MGRSARLALAVLAVALGLGACSTGGGAAKESLPPITGPKVDAADFVFKPSSITVAAGESITWDFVGSSGHNVVAKDKSFKSKVLGRGARFSHAFTTAGTYEYVCTLHPRMTGTVTVTG